MTELLDEVDSRDGLRRGGNVLDLLSTVLPNGPGCVRPDPDIAHRALMLQITNAVFDGFIPLDLTWVR